MDCRVEIPNVIDCEVTLPESKSIMARALIINALGELTEAQESSPPCCHTPQLATAHCDDISILTRALTSDSDHINVEGSGTAMRFLTAYFACQDGRTVTLDGNDRMRQRPIAPLVDALRQMGASIDYLGNEGFPPLRIAGGKLHGGHIRMRGDVSSQFVSAVLMISPAVGGIILELEEEIVSRPYIDMTLALMRHYGVDAMWANGACQIVVPAGHYIANHLEIEGDWSAASYWFALKALLPQSRIVLSPLHAQSIQGDRAIVEMMAPLGVEAQFFEDSVVILPPSPSILEGELDLAAPSNETGLVTTLGSYERDMASTPDLVPTLAVTLCLLRVPFTLTGVRSLRIKESDRIKALTVELAKLGYTIESDDDTMRYNGNHRESGRDITIDPHDDHRIAMAMSLAATRHPSITIKNAEVVTKSYPDFFSQILKT